MKLNDADLIGLPVRLVVSPRNLKNNVVEVKGRKDPEAETVPADELFPRLRQILGLPTDIQGTPVRELRL